MKERGYQSLSFHHWSWGFVKALQMDFHQCLQLNISKMSSGFLFIPSFSSALSRQRAGCTTPLGIYLHLPPPHADIVKSRTVTEWGHFGFKQELWKAFFRKNHHRFNHIQRAKEENKLRWLEQLWSGPRSWQLYSCFSHARYSVNHLLTAPCVSDNCWAVATHNKALQFVCCNTPLPGNSNCARRL